MNEFLETMWDRFGALVFDDIPNEVVAVAHHSVLDWFGCALAGSREPLVALLSDELVGSDGTCSIVGGDRRTDVYRASIVNGAAGHALDFDDSNTVMGGHPTAPLLPGLLAVAESDGRAGVDVVTAYVVGLEIAARIGLAIGPEHYAQGWHVTSTIGIFGAAAATAWMLGLDRERFGHAIGIATSSAAGLKANFGTMTKPLHAGQAAERGVLAARLAARGYTANPDALDAGQGLAQAAGSGSLDLDRSLRWADRWATTRTVFKFHAACHFTHAAIEATRSILDQGLPVDDIEDVTLVVNPSIIDVCGIAHPTTGLEAKFSLRGTQALLLSGADTAAVETFDDARINSPRVQALLGRVSVQTDPTIPALAARSMVTTRTGTTEATADIGRPEADLERQRTRLDAKFIALATPVIGCEATERLGDRLHDLPNVTDVSTLFEL
jgi:2-methylcitrate dehydratase PrpD